MTPWPAPQVRACTVTLDDEIVPTGARSLARAARAAGWGTSLRYARGTKPTAKWEPGEVVDSIVLRAWRGPLLIVATYVNGKFKTGWLQRGRGQPVEVGARALSALLKI